MIPYGRHYLDEDDIAAVVSVLRHGDLTQGPMIANFEQAITEYTGVQYAVAVSSGTAALHLACMAANIERSDNVITSANTFVATANCAAYLNANIVFTDIHPETLNIDPALLGEKCKDIGQVKAIIPVHFAGLPCDMYEIQKIANSYNVTLIEDAAHALGAVYKDGSKVGCCKYSDMTIFSLHPVKSIAAGEGGIITTNNAHLYKKLIRLRNHGINKNPTEFLVPEQSKNGSSINTWYYEMQELGFNYRITDIQCALALSQLKKLDKFINKRRDIAKKYDKELTHIPYLTVTQKEGRQFSSSHLYVVQIDFDSLGIIRSNFMQKLLDNDIHTQIHYIPVYMQPYYKKKGYNDKELRNTKSYYDKALSLPIYYALSNSEQEYVIKTIENIINEI